jgi:hypothetical protein
MSDDKIAQALNMRSLQEINDEKQELLDEVNPDKLPDLPVNAFSTNEEVENLPIEAPVRYPVVIDDAGASMGKFSTSSFVEKALTGRSGNLSGFTSSNNSCFSSLISCNDLMFNACAILSSLIYYLSFLSHFPITIFIDPSASFS